MKHETEFESYLRTVKRSAKTDLPFSARVARDTVSRCKAVERALEEELSSRTVGTETGLHKVIDAIKSARLGVTERRLYAYNDKILAVRTYREFLTWRELQLA